MIDVITFNVFLNVFSITVMVIWQIHINASIKVTLCTQIFIACPINVAITNIYCLTYQFQLEDIDIDWANSKYLVYIKHCQINIIDLCITCGMKYIEILSICNELMS